MKFVDFKENKSLYAVVFAGVALGVADHYSVKLGWLGDWALKLLGRAELREAIRAKSKESAEDIIDLVEGILAQVVLTQPPSPPPQTDLTGAVVKTVPIEVKELGPLVTFESK